MTDNTNGTATIIPFKAPVPKCSFCGTPETEVKQFFSSGTGKHICNVCVVYAKKRMEQNSG